MSSIAVLGYKNAYVPRARKGLFQRSFLLLVVFLAVVLAFELVFHFALMPRMIIDAIHIDAPADFPLTATEIDSIAGLDHSPSYFSVDPAAVKLRLEQYPLIGEATVRKTFPNGIAISLIEREPFAVSLVETPSGNVPVSFDDHGVVVAVGNLSKGFDLPVVSGITIPEIRLGMRLPAELGAFLSNLDQIKREDPSLFAEVSEIKFVRKGGTDFDALIYPTSYRVPVWIGETIDDRQLKYVMMTLDVIAKQGMVDKLSEVDFRDGQVVYRVKGERSVPADSLIVGLDIGTTKVCAVIGQFNDHGAIEITGVGLSPSVGLRRGVVINIEATLRSVAQAIESAEMMSGREVQSVYSGIAGAHIEGLNSRGVVAVTGKGREITKEDVDRVIDAAKAVVIPMDREVLHVIPQEFIVDDQRGVKNPVDMIGIRLEAEVHIITGSVTSAQNLVKCVNRAGFKVNDIILQSLASGQAVLSDDEKELGVLLIDLGGGTADILVYLDGAPYHTNVIALGGNQVTSDLAIMLKTPQDAAERIKKEAGCCYMPLVDSGEEAVLPGVGGWPAQAVPRKELCRIIQPRMTEIFNIAKDQVVKKNYLGLLGGGVVLTGGGALLPGAVELAQEVFGLPARIGLPGAYGGLASEYQSPIYSTAVGLILSGASSLDRDRRYESASGRKSGEGFIVRLRDWMKEFF